MQTASLGAFMFRTITYTQEKVKTEGRQTPNVHDSM